MRARLPVFISFVACWLSLASNAKAQLNSGCFAAHYSQYIAQTVGADHASIIQTVQVSGYTETKNPAVWMGPQLGWQYPCTSQINQMQTSTHTSNIRNLVGSTGGNYSQGPTPALNYNNYTISITAPATPGTVYGSETSSGVVCTIAGGIFAGGGGNGYIEIAYTRLINMGGPWTNCAVGKITTVCDIPVATWCTVSTTPPDYIANKVRAMTFPVAPASFWDAFSVCIRPLGFGPFICSPSIAIDIYSPQPTAFCTKNWQ
jgi:hypothetical protein